MRMTDRDTGIQTEYYCHEIELNPERPLSLDVHLRNDNIPFSLQLMVESNNDIDTYQIGNKMEIQQEPYFFQNTLDKIKSEPKTIQGSDVHIKTETPLVSDFIEQSDFSKEIKEEPEYFEITFPKLKSEPEEFYPENMHLHSDIQDNATEGNKEFFLSEAIRLDAKTSWDRRCGIFSEDLENSCLELSSCNENANVIHGFNNLGPHSLIPEHKIMFPCDRCDLKFTTEHGLKAHSFIHENNSPFRCDLCNMSFVSFMNLEEHNFVHDGQKLLKGNQCDKNFTIEHYQEVYDIYHEHPYKCNNCDKRYSSAHRLKNHSLIHESESQNMCIKCNMSFTTAHSLKRHNSIHEGKRPFQCTKCNKSFNRAYNLKTHILTHEGKNPFRCKNCDKSFSRAYYLKKHSANHCRQNST